MGYAKQNSGVVGALKKQAVPHLTPLAVSVQRSVFAGTTAHMASEDGPHDTSTLYILVTRLVSLLTVCKAILGQCQKFVPLHSCIWNEMWKK